MIVDQLDYSRGVGDDDEAFLEKMKSLEGSLDLVTIKTPTLEIKTTNPERYSSFDGEYVFSVKTRKKIEILPSKGRVLSKKEGVVTISANNYDNYKSIIDNI